MKRIVRYIMVIGLVTVLSTPITEARTGRGNGRDNNRTEQRQHNSGSRPGGNHGNRPNGGNHGNRPGGNNPGNRPNGGNHGNHQGGGNNHGNHPGTRPGGNHPGGVNHGNYGHGKPSHSYNYNHRHPSHHCPPPRHDHWPHYYRPTPPPHYVYHAHGPSFGSILGMVLGTAFNTSLNYLYNNGYAVSGYGNNAIYLNNVSQMNYNWPNAVLYYNGGLLSSSQYIYSTTWNDLGRYNNLYNNFCGQYGYPASVNNSGGVMSASWFGYDGRFVTIQYSPGFSANGNGCFYTTLTFGN